MDGLHPNFKGPSKPTYTDKSRPRYAQTSATYSCISFLEVARFLKFTEYEANACLYCLHHCADSFMYSKNREIR